MKKGLLILSIMILLTGCGGGNSQTSSSASSSIPTSVTGQFMLLLTWEMFHF